MYLDSGKLKSHVFLGIRLSGVGVVVSEGKPRKKTRDRCIS